ncbi:hypothetical protein FGB62_112g112 [Gracilaria domingensis]|nr:hypothetical protein FGB62_112g112 [Gracilaria domingensis]
MESEPLLERRSGRYAIRDRISRQFRKRGAKSNEAIEDVLNDMEKSERLSGRVFIVSFLAILGHVAIGTIVMCLLEGWSLYDAVYFCVVTTTTVGYGDVTPSRGISKLFVIYYVIASIAIISTMLTFVVGALVNRQEEFLLRAIVGDEDSDEEEQQLGTRGYSAVDKSDIQELLVSLFWLGVILSLGVLLFIRIEKFSLLDAMYVTVISTSTVGFGDLLPKHNSSKVILTVWLCFSTIYAAKVVSEVAGVVAQLNQHSAMKRLLSASMDMRTFMRMDRDNDQRLDKAEFLAQMLIRLGKVTDDDVQPLLRRFHELDKDNSGFISREDVH